MTAPNHIIGGIVITGLFGSFMNLNILASPWYIATTVIASLLPDIDHTKSVMGRVFLPFSKFINRRFGHRTITHSLIALIGSSLAVAWAEATFFDGSQFAKTYFLAYMSHLILDMMTVQGVPLLYPFMGNPCVLPGNPEMRFRTGNLRTETMIFCFFLLSAVFLQPLIKNGFWTQYNRFFGTPKHLVSEYNKTSDALMVDYLVKKGTEEITGTGLCIEASESEIVLLEYNQFHILSKDKYIIKEVIPTHTGQELKFEQISFMNISIDSLNTLINRFPIQHIDIQSNNEFAIHHNNLQEFKNNFKTDYPEKLWFQEIEVPVSKEAIVFHSNPKINTLRNQIHIIESQNKLILQEYQRSIDKLQSLKTQYSSTSNIITKERLLRQIKSLEKIKSPKIDEHKITELQIKIKELQIADQIKNQEKRKEINNKYIESLPAQTKITGFITRIIISDLEVA